MSGNVVKLRLQEGRATTSSGLYQYDYGQKLVFTGAELPETYEVHFSNCKEGRSKTMIGTPEGVDIPDEFLLCGEPVYVWVFLHNTETDGETEYEGVINVTKRARPTETKIRPVQQDVITKAIAALHDAVQKTAQDVIAANEAKDAAEAAQGLAEAAQAAAEIAAGLAEDYKDEANASAVASAEAQAAAEAAQSAAETAQALAESAKTAAEAAQTAAESAAASAGEYKDESEAAKAAAEAAQAAAERAQAASETAQAAAEAARARAESAQTAAENAQTAAENAQAQAENAQHAAESAQQSAENAQAGAEEAQSKAEDAQAAAETAQAASETARDTAEQWATGGTSGTPSATNNAKYYAEQAAASATTASNKADEAAQSAQSASEDAEDVRDIAEAMPQQIQEALQAAKDSGEFDGFSPIATVVKNDNVATITITDLNGTTTTQVFDGDDPSDLIDDTAGAADTDKVWSADKTTAELSAKADKTDTVLNTTLSRGRKTNTTVGTGSFAFGNNVEARGDFSHAEGLGAIASGFYSHAEGANTIATGVDSHAEGGGTMASGESSHAEGNGAKAQGTYSHAEGGGTTASKTGSHAEGSGTTASGENAHAEGGSAKAQGDQSHAEGTATTASGISSHAEGAGTTSSGISSHAEGSGTTASGNCSHSEGANTTASGNYSHVEGLETVAAGTYSHVFGCDNVSDSYSNWNEWVADTSYSVGDKVKRTFSASNIKGYICKTANSDSTFTSSKWTEQYGKMNYVEIVGNGTGTSNRSNARTLDWDGNEYLYGDVYVHANTDSTGGAKVATEDFADDIIVVQDTVPLTSQTKIWLPETQTTPVQIPTYTEFSSLQTTVDGLPTDVQINGTSIVNQGVANVPIANSSKIGAVKIDGNSGLSIPESDGVLKIKCAGLARIKAGTNAYEPIVAFHQHESVFYGLAKAAGDSTQASSSNAVGTYTNNAKAAIRKMLGALGPNNISTGLYLEAEAETGDWALNTNVADVQVNSTSIVNNGIANIPIADSTTFGAVKVGSGLNVYQNALTINPANSSLVKAGTAEVRAIVPLHQHESVFYGLAKAAGDSTQASSDNTVGTYTADAKSAIKSMLGVNVDDVQVNGTSVVTSRVANVPIAGENTFGVVKVRDFTDGLRVDNGTLTIYRASDLQIKTGSEFFRTIVPANQHNAVFYGLATAAGDSTQSSSSNAVGTYTDTAKAAIQHMLGTDTIIAPNETDNTAASQAYAIGELFTMNSKLYKATSAIAANDTIISGTNCTETNAVSTFPRDVRVHGTSVVTNGIANIPMATSTVMGALILGDGFSTDNSTGRTNVNYAGADDCKAGTSMKKSISPYQQYRSVFYGLAKAAGDSTQSASSNAVGTYTTDAKAAIQTMLGIPSDVQVNGTSVLNNGIADIPLGVDSFSAGVVTPCANDGIGISSGKLFINNASDNQIKAGANQYRPITPSNQHGSAFYGLAKAAGDSTQAASDNAVGIYTNDAKTAIQTMLGVPGDVQMDGTSIVANGIANIPRASYQNYGVAKFDSGGFFISSNGSVLINRAVTATIKPGTNDTSPIVPSFQHVSTFYGLAKAAGDTTQSVSDNAIGVYTDTAKASILSMIGARRSAELIADYTTTEDLATVVVNTDTNGNPFKLDTFLAYVLFPNAYSNDYIASQMSGKVIGSSASTAALSSLTLRLISGVQTTLVYFATIINGILLVLGKSSAGGNTQSPQWSTTTLLVNDIQSFGISQHSSTSQIIPSGTNIKIYGVRHLE